MFVDFEPNIAPTLEGGSERMAQSKWKGIFSFAMIGPKTSPFLAKFPRAPAAFARVLSSWSVSAFFRTGIDGARRE